MNDFTLWVSLFVLIGLAVVLVPWFMSKSRQEQDTLTNAKIVKQRLTELDRELSEGLLSESDKQDAVNELKIDLLDEKEQHNLTHSRAWPIVVVGALLSIGGGVAVYLHANQVASLQHWDSAKESVQSLGRRIVIEADPSVTPEEIQDFALGLRTRLLEKPDDPTGWLLLGRLYASLNRLEGAFEAFEKSLALKPDNTGALMSYAQGLLMTGQENYMQQAVGLLQRVLQQDSNNTSALGMMALATTQLGDKPRALASWMKLQTLLPTDDEFQGEISKQIAALTGQDNSTGTSVIVQVSLDNSLLEKVPEDAFLLVYAQDAEGASRMPAAVIKQKLSALPVELVLSDENAMMPTFTLSSLKEARLIARISEGNDVTDKSGDLQGSVVLTLQQGKQVQQQIVIDKELP